MPTYSRKNWTHAVSRAIREEDPEQARKHRLWADTQAAALAALQELRTEFEGAGLVKGQRLIRLRGGGEIRAENAEGFHDQTALVGVWFSEKDVPQSLRFRVTDAGPICVLLEPVE